MKRLMTFLVVAMAMVTMERVSNAALYTIGNANYEGNDYKLIYEGTLGGYGLVWIIKDVAFPDPSWQAKVTIGGGINAFVLVLGWYWAFGWLLISGTSAPDYPLPDAVWFCLCISLCIVGCTIMIAADAQKYFTLRERRGLITDGMYRYIRHPNYLGEIMIYGSFALMVWHWLPAVVLAWVWLGVFASNMVMKEASMSRYPEWAAYKKQLDSIGLPNVLAVVQKVWSRMYGK